MNDIAGFALHNRDALKEITFGGTKEPWASVMKQDAWIHSNNLSRLTIHCTGGDITGSGEAGQEASTWPTIRGDVMYKQRDYIVPATGRQLFPAGCFKFSRKEKFIL